MSTSVRCPALLIGAPGSGHGKTSITAGLIRYHVQQGKNVRAFKIGPDFIDPTILERASYQPAKQLDLWMMGTDECRRLLFKAASSCDLIIIEGVIGLFDGSPCTADFAKLFSIPVANVVNARGMAQTAHAVAHGLTTYDQNLNVLGYAVNGVNSARHDQMIREGIDSDRFFGCVKNDSRHSIPSRHLGLMQADELANLEEIIDGLAASVATTALTKCHQPVEFYAPNDDDDDPIVESNLNGLSIAVARDAAFSFIYHENLRFLEKLGAKLEFFSPIDDAAVPSASALYLPGGYPELYAAKLAANTDMLSSVRQFAERQRPIYAECGGMLYLLDALTLSGDQTYKFCGIIPGSAKLQSKFVALGYQSLLLPGMETAVRSHTFHYSSVDCLIAPSANAIKRADDSAGEGFFQSGSVSASYLHTYFPSSSCFIEMVFSVLGNANRPAPEPS